MDLRINSQQFKNRKKGFIRWVDYCLSYPTKLKEIAAKLDQQVEKGNLPYHPTRSEERLEKSSKTLHSEYFYTIFISRSTDIILMKEGELIRSFKEFYDSKMPAYLGQDGSRGQWRVAKNYGIHTYLWYAGMWSPQHHGDKAEATEGIRI